MIFVEASVVNAYCAVVLEGILGRDVGCGVILIFQGQANDFVPAAKIAVEVEARDGGYVGHVFGSPSRCIGNAYGEFQFQTTTDDNVMPSLPPI
ncbi:hypothetical protein D3C80_1034090 [compost metagenome]